MIVLKIAHEMYSKLGEECATLLPETIPFLAELMEGEWVASVWGVCLCVGVCLCANVDEWVASVSVCWYVGVSVCVRMRGLHNCIQKSCIYTGGEG